MTNPGYAGPDPFNFVVGNQYTIRWPPPGLRSNTLAGRCGGDIFDTDAGELLFDPPMAAENRGFIDIGVNGTPGSSGAAFIRQAIVSNTQSHDLVVGQPIVHAQGQRQTEDAALRERISQDRDPYSPTYADYMANTDAYGNITGNGRRIVFMPVDNIYDEDRVIEFATFFLPVADYVCCPQGGCDPLDNEEPPQPCCAEYVGSGILYGIRNAASDDVAIYVPRLTE